MRMLSSKISGYARNRFRLETVSADTGKAGKIITVNLIENAIIDLRSWKMHMDVKTNSKTVNGKTVYGRLSDGSSLISRMELYLNGIQIQQGCADYNRLCKVLKIGGSSRDKDGSLNRALSKGSIEMTDAVEEVSVVISEWKGFMGSATRYLDTALLGSLQIRLTLANNDVLVPKSAGVGIAGDLDTVDARTAASQLEYECSNIFFTLDTIQVDPIYSEMLKTRLAQEQSIDIPYKEYYTFSLSNITGPSHTTRFSLSSGSIDRLFGTFLDTNHMTVGVKGHLLPNASLTDSSVANAFRFMSYDSSSTKAGSLKYVWNINNVQHPQYQASVLDALYDVAYCEDKIHPDSQGNMITSLQSFNAGQFVIPLVLNHPGEPVYVRSGLDSRGINTQMSLHLQGMVPPTADDDKQTTNSFSSFIVAETTAVLSIGLGRAASISF